MTSAKADDLWGPTIDVKVRSPLVILKTQAVMLERKTAGLLRADIDTCLINESVTHRFDVIAPSLDYRLTLFTVTHDPELVYPVSLHTSHLREDASSDTDFVTLLAKFLQSGRTKSILNSLLARINDSAEAKIA